MEMNGKESQLKLAWLMCARLNVFGQVRAPNGVKTYAHGDKCLTGGKNRSWTSHREKHGEFDPTFHNVPFDMEKGNTGQHTNKTWAHMHSVLQDYWRGNALYKRSNRQTDTARERKHVLIEVLKGLPLISSIARALREKRHLTTNKSCTHQLEKLSDDQRHMSTLRLSCDRKQPGVEQNQLSGEKLNNTNIHWWISSGHDRLFSTEMLNVWGSYVGLFLSAGG